MLAKICEQTFLKMWVYPNLYMKVAKELCDVLVVFENHVFIFSVKHSEFNSDIDIAVSWPRWKRKVIDKSIKQIERAEQWILSHPNEIFLDARCREKLPISVDIENLKIHRIIVAHGAENACTGHAAENIAGSLATLYLDENSETTYPLAPFCVKLPRNKVFHLLDSYNLEIILGELDTITDFLRYVEAKENAIQKYKVLAYTGEEDLLAHYFLSYDKKSKGHVIGHSKIAAEGLYVEEGEWNSYSNSLLYKTKKQQDRVSYFWDHLLQVTSQNALDGNLLGDDVYNGQSALREMAKEPRFMRRELSRAIKNSIDRFPNFADQRGRNIASYPSYFNDKRYVFLQTTPPLTDQEQHIHRQRRQEMLKIGCGVERIKRPKSNIVIGIAIDAPKYSKKNSEDFVLLNCIGWSEKEERFFTEKNKLLSFFETDEIEVRQVKAREFPLPNRRSQNIQKTKIGRNSLCYCGSNKKYKKCCIGK